MQLNFEKINIFILLSTTYPQFVDIIMLINLFVDTYLFFKIYYFA